MAGVCNKTGLPVAGFGQGPQHRVKGLGEPGKFVTAEHRDWSQVIGTGDPFGGLGELAHRPQSGSSHHAAGHGGDHHPDTSDRQ